MIAPQPTMVSSQDPPTIEVQPTIQQPMGTSIQPTMEKVQSEGMQSQDEKYDPERLRGGGCCGCFWGVLCAPVIALGACLGAICCCAC